MKAIVAINQHGYIGRNGQMMWKSSPDFKHFKEITMGGVLICGRITYEQCLGSKELPGRITLVVSNSPSPGPLKPYGQIMDTLSTAIITKRPIWVIGGGQIYDILLPLCNELHLSHIDNADIGDVKFKVPANFNGEVFDYYFRENKKA